MNWLLTLVWFESMWRGVKVTILVRLKYDKVIPTPIWKIQICKGDNSLVINKVWGSVCELTASYVFICLLSRIYTLWYWNFSCVMLHLSYSTLRISTLCTVLVIVCIAEENKLYLIGFAVFANWFDRPITSNGVNRELACPFAASQAQFHLQRTKNYPSVLVYITLQQ